MSTFCKTILFVIFLGLVPCRTQAKTYDATQLPIVVRNMPEWSNEYPTVINNWEGMFVKSIIGKLPPLLSVITAINGKDTKGINEEDFNTLLMSQNICKIDYLAKSEGNNIKNQCTIQYYSSIYWPGGISMVYPEAFPEDIEIHNIKNASVFSKNTFTYKMNEITDIDEIAVFEAAGKALSKLGFAKTEEENNADMILTLSKDRDKYNGYKIALCIYDGEKMREGVERALWALDVVDLRENLKAQESAIKTAIYKMCNNFPFDQPTYSYSINTIGVAFENAHSAYTGKVIRVMKGSDAYEKGLRSGDVVTKAFTRKNFILGTSRFLYKVKNNYGEIITMNGPFEKKNINIKFIL